MKTDIYNQKPAQFDSRDFIERMEELRDELDSLVSAVQDAETPDETGEACDALVAWLGQSPGEMKDYDFITFTGSAEDLETWGRSPESYELAAMETFAVDASGASDWQYGAQFIREDEFEDYAREFAEDIGAIDRNAGWPACHIDWPAAAASLKQDYSEFEFDGTTYLARA
jgi:hypothetical protein